MGNLLPIFGLLGAAVGFGWAYMKVGKGKGLATAIAGAVLFMVGAGFVGYFTGYLGGELGVTVSDVVGGFLGGLGAGLAVMAALKETALKG